MTDTWIELTVGGERVRHELPPGLTRAGGAQCEVSVPQARDDQLHFWTDPAKVLFVGATTTPLLNGRAFEEAELSDGDSIQWAGAVLVFRSRKAPVLQELPPEGPAASSTAASSSGFGPAVSGDRAQRRLLAGLAADLGLADKAVVQRWQQAVLRNEYDADGCARDVLGSAGLVPDDPRVLERAGRLQRDLLMMPMQRGTRGVARRARGATRRGAAYLVANLIAISVYTLVLVAIMLLVRVQYDFSFDETIDGFLELVTLSEKEPGP